MNQFRTSAANTKRRAKKGLLGKTLSSSATAGYISNVAYQLQKKTNDLLHFSINKKENYQKLLEKCFSSISQKGFLLSL